MVKQREGYKFIVHEPAKTWLAADKCAGCGKEKKEWKRSTRWKCCSTECTDKYVRECTSFGWGEYRLRVFRRDKFTCAMCGTKPIPMQTEFEKIYNSDGEHTSWNRKLVPVEEPTEYDYATMLIGDHIQPIALNGNEWEMSNIQTLCIPCNKIKTRGDMGKIAQLRIKEELGKAGQKFLDRIEIEEREKSESFKYNIDTEPL